MESTTNFRDWLELDDMCGSREAVNAEQAILNPGKVYGGYFAKQYGKRILLRHKSHEYALCLASELAKMTFLSILRMDYM